MKKNELLKMIMDLQEKVARLEKLVTPQQINLPFIRQEPNQTYYELGCLNGVHDYPNPWNATIPPHCRKCGQSAPRYEIICQDGSTVTLCDNFPDKIITTGLISKV